MSLFRRFTRRCCCPCSPAPSLPVLITVLPLMGESLDRQLRELAENPTATGAEMVATDLEGTARACRNLQAAMIREATR